MNQLYQESQKVVGQSSFININCQSKQQDEPLTKKIKKGRPKMDQDQKTKSQFYKYKESFLRLFQQKQIMKDKEPINYFQNTFQRQKELYCQQKNIDSIGKEKDYQTYLISKKRKENVKKLKKEIECMKAIQQYVNQDENLVKSCIDFKEIVKINSKENLIEDKVKKMYESISYPSQMEVIENNELEELKQRLMDQQCYEMAKVRVDNQNQENWKILQKMLKCIKDFNELYEQNQHQHQNQYQVDDENGFQLQKPASIQLWSEKGRVNRNLDVNVQKQDSLLTEIMDQNNNDGVICILNNHESNQNNHETNQNNHETNQNNHETNQNNTNINNHQNIGIFQTNLNINNNNGIFQKFGQCQEKVANGVGNGVENGVENGKKQFIDEESWSEGENQNRSLQSVFQLKQNILKNRKIENQKDRQRKQRRSMDIPNIILNHKPEIL